MIKRFIRFVRVVAYAAAASIATLVVVAAAAVAALQIDGVGRRAAGWVAAAAAPPGTAVTVGSVSGLVPVDFRIERLALADSHGVWLTARRLEVAWRPWRLLADAIAVDRVGVEEVRLERLPAAVPEPAAAAPGGEFDARALFDALPMDVTVGTLALRPLTVGADVAGETVTLVVEGDASISRADGDAALGLTVERIDATPGHLDVVARYAAATRRLEIHALLDEPAGGAAARLLGRPGLPAVTLAVDGAGPLDDWRATFLARAGDVVRLDGRARLADGILRMTLDGEAAPDPALGAPPALAGAGPLRLTAALAWPLRGAVAVDEATLAHDWLSATARGEVDPFASRIDAELTLDVPDMARLAPVVGATVGGRLRTEVRVAGAIERPAIDAHVSAGDVAAGSLAIESATADVAADLPPAAGGTYRITAAGALTRVAIDGEPLAPWLAPTIDWKAIAEADPRSGTATLTDVAVTAGDVRLAGDAEVAAWGERIDGRVALALGSLDRFSGPAGMSLAGRAEADATFTAHPAAGGFRADTTVVLASFATGDAVVDALTGDHPTVAAVVESAAGELRVRDLTIRARAGTVGGAVTIDPAAATVAADLRADLPALGVLSDAAGVALAGAAAVNATLRGPLAGPAAEAAFAATGLAVAGRAVDDLGGRITADNLAAPPRGTLAVETRAAGVAVEARTRYAMPDAHTLALDGLSLAGGGDRLTGDLALDMRHGTVRGALSGALGDVAPWAALAGVTAAGRVALEARLGAEEGRQDAEVRLQASNLSADHPDGRAEVRELTLDVRASDLFGAPSGEADVRAAGARAAGAAIDSFEARLRATAGTVAVDATASGRATVPFTVAAAGRVAIDGARYTVVVERLDGTLASEPVALAGPATIDIAPSRVRLHPTTVQSGDARLTAAASLDGETVDASAALDGLSLARLAPFVPDPRLAGTIAAEATLSGTLAAPRLRLEATGTGIRAAAVAADLVPPADVRIEGGWDGARVTASARAASGEAAAIEATVDAPLAWRAAEGTLAMPPDAPISGRLAFNTDLALAGALVLPEGDHLGGPAAGELVLGGTVAQPTISARGSVAGGTFENMATGAVLRNIGLEIEGRERTIIVSSLTADDGGDGRLSGNGRVELDPAAGFPFALEVAAKSVMVARRDEAQVDADADVTIDGDASGIRAAGTVTVNEAELRFPDRLPGEVVALEVTEINGPPGPQPAADGTADAAAALPVTLDVTIDIPARAFLRGRNLDSEWSGRLRITGTADAPAVVGRLELVRGNFNLAGKTIALRNGTVTFDGAADLDASLDVVGAITAGGVDAEIVVSGRFSNPRVTLRSSPELPPDEILARILFDKEQRRLTPFQAAQIAQTASALSGGGSSFDIVGAIRRTFDIDTFEVGGEEGAESATLKAGKYVTENVFLSVEQGITAESSGVKVEVEVLPNVTIETDVGSDAAGEIGVNYRIDY